MVAKILVGGCRYDTTGLNKDKDYIIIEEGNIPSLHCSKEDGNDLMIYSEQYIKDILDGKDYHGKEYVLLALCNQNEYPVNFSLYNEENFNLIYKWYHSWVRGLIKIRSNASKLLMYPFVMMFYKKNGEYKLSDKQQECVNQVHRLFKIDETYINHFISFYQLTEEESETFRNRMQSRPLMTEEAIEEKRKELEERLKGKYRIKREPLLVAFDKWEKAVLRGRESDSQEIMVWYQKLKELDEYALENIPERIKYYL